MPRYTTADYDPAGDQTWEQWATELAEQGWRTYMGPGHWLDVNERRVWRVWLVKYPTASTGVRHPAARCSPFALPSTE